MAVVAGDRATVPGRVAGWQGCQAGWEYLAGRLGLGEAQHGLQRLARELHQLGEVEALPTRRPVLTAPLSTKSTSQYSRYQDNAQRTTVYCTVPYDTRSIYQGSIRRRASTAAAARSTPPSPVCMRVGRSVKSASPCLDGRVPLRRRRHRPLRLLAFAAVRRACYPMEPLPMEPSGAK